MGFCNFVFIEVISDVFRLIIDEYGEKKGILGIISAIGSRVRLTANWPRETPHHRVISAAFHLMIDIGTLIEKPPDIREGRPCIAGKGVTVRRIAGWHNLGLTPEGIAAKIEHLSLAQVHAALTYYHANHAEIDSDIAEEEAEAERILSKPANVT